MNYENIRIKRLIHEKGYTQKTFAIKLGITPEYLCRMLRTKLDEYEEKAMVEALEDNMGLWRKLHRTYLR